ncbi:hypothetical protein CUMW_036220 [Citrus unshiu]|nr:hypothetical protein CUMW_036220 [Citrus unshiu]
MPHAHQNVLMSCCSHARAARSPQYNVVRLAYMIVAALILGSMFWDVANHYNKLFKDSSQGLFMVMEALYASCLFLGVNNAASVQTIVSIERTVFYREKAAEMYSPIPFAVAQDKQMMKISIASSTWSYGNYVCLRAKTFIQCHHVFHVTPNQLLAAIISSAIYSLLNLLSSFLIPQPIRMSNCMEYDSYNNGLLYSIVPDNYISDINIMSLSS